jgi:hypothetical protein
MSSSDNSFTIRDNNSQILSILPNEGWVEALVIISRVEGFNGIDSYVLSLIKDRLNMFLDTRDELGESFKKYMQTIEGLEDLSTAAEKENEEKSNKEDNSSRFVKDVHEGYNDLKKTENKDLR